MPKTAKKGHKKQQPKESVEVKLTIKEQLAQKREKAKVRQAFLQYTSSVVAASGLVGAIAAFTLEPIMGIAAALGIACLAMCFKYPRPALYAFVIYIPFGGTVTYALGGNALLQLAKDAFFIPAAIGVFLFCQKYKQRLILPESIRIPFIILMTWMTAVLLFVNGSQQLSAEGEQPILLGILGFKAVMGYFFLITCIYYLIRNKSDLYGLLRLQCVLVLICCGLGFIQYLMLKNGTCPPTEGTGDALFKASLESRCFVGGSLLYSPQFGVTRLPGTFVAPWQWGWFLISSAFFSFGTAFNDSNFLWRIVGIGSMASVFVMSFLSGQRIALALVPVVVVLLLFVTGQLRFSNLKRFLPIAVGLALALVFMASRNPEIVTGSIENLQGRWNASPPHKMIMRQLEWAGEKQEGIFGRGVGRATNAARMFGETQLVETYHSKILYEIGYVGLFLLLGLFTVITVTTFKSYRSVKDPNLRGYGASMWVFIAFISYFPYYYPLDVDPVNVYYWLAVGIVAKLPDIDRQERLERSSDDESSQKLTKKELKLLRQMENAAKF
jgi:hypothetical protein